LFPKAAISDYLEISDHPVDNFARELTALEDLDNFVNSIWRVVEQCQTSQIAHNLFLARGRTSGLLRAILWPRRSVYTAKSLSPLDSVAMTNGDSYNIAVAELAGMFVVAGDEVAEQLVQHGGLFKALKHERLSSDVINHLIASLSRDKMQ
uniref:HDOD domain-containing protein n=1 Tax=Echinostoma caproni TaxID=27848 RepID=A0A183ATR0_9TREM